MKQSVVSSVSTMWVLYDVQTISGYLGGYDVIGLILVFGDDPLQVTAELCGRREEVETDSDHLPALL